MKINKLVLFLALPLLAIPLLTGCNNHEEEEEKPLEIGDTVKEWTSDKNYADLPLLPLNEDSEGEIQKKFGNGDKCSLKYSVISVSASKNYLGSDVLEEPYFTESDVKNGDIVSLYFYVPSDSNLATLQLQLFPISMNKPIKADVITIGEDNQEQWIRTAVSFDTLETLGAIRLYYTVTDANEPASFFIDDIHIMYGAETVKTDYEYNDESLYRTYQDYFKVGACMSASMLQNTELRRIAKDNFNSLTAENEAKPEQILDQKGCKELAKEDEGLVAITVKPFEKLYDFCEANHIGVRHHTFVWYSQVPAWFFNKGYKDNGTKVSKDVMLQRMENFIKVTLETINNRWPGLVYAIDVANEAVDNHTIRNNNNNWYTVVGKDFVYYAFKYARMYATEEQKLYYNDYSFDYDTQNCKYALNTLLKQAIEEGLVDGVGIQSHTGSDQDMTTIMNDAKMIHEKGLECQITELDITINGTSKKEYDNQKKAYKTLITKVLKANEAEETNITAVVVWGIRDNESWKRNQYPLLFTEKYGKKPAYYGFLEAIEAVRPAEEEAIS